MSGRIIPGSYQAGAGSKTRATVTARVKLQRMLYLRVSNVAGCPLPHGGAVSAHDIDGAACRRGSALHDARALPLIPPDPSYRETRLARAARVRREPRP